MSDISDNARAFIQASADRHFAMVEENERLRDGLLACLDWMEITRKSGDGGNWEWSGDDAYSKGLALLSPERTDQECDCCAGVVLTPKFSEQFPCPKCASPIRTKETGE